MENIQALNIANIKNTGEQNKRVLGDLSIN